MTRVRYHHNSATAAAASSNLPYRPPPVPVPSSLPPPSAHKQVNGTSYWHQKQKVQEAYNYLGRVIGYRNHQVDMHKLWIVLADALTTLEKLTGKTMTLRPREMDLADIVQRIARLVAQDPTQKSKIKQINKTSGNLAARAAKVVVLADYIQSLQMLEIGRSEAEKIRQTPIPPAKRSTEQYTVVQTLQHMEDWCDAWLRGDMTSDDWNTFEHCLEQDVSEAE